MNSLKRVSCLRQSSCKLWIYETAAQQSTTAPTTQNSDVKIKIPSRIERGPTDVLQAISDAIPEDTTTYSYKYLDDRFFRPTNIRHKINFALARESGKRVAEWIHKTHYDLFPKTDDDPRILAYNSKILSTTKDAASEDMLVTEISKGNVEAALHCYDMLEETVSTETKLSLFELLCFHGGHIPPEDHQYPQYRYFVLKPSRNTVTWAEDPVLKKLFSDLTAQDSTTAAAAYNALISGMTKYNRVSDALTLFHECKEKSIPISVSTYNQFLSNTYILGSTMDERRTTFLSILSSMLRDSPVPNVTTLNCCLQAMIFCVPPGECFEIMRTIMKYFQQWGVQPSLGSYFLLLCSAPSIGENGNSIFASILDEVGTRQFEIQDINDTKFFTLAMQLCDCDFDNVSYAMKLHKVLCSYNNKEFLWPITAASKYYSALISVTLRHLPLGEFYDIYTSIVPYTQMLLTPAYDALLKKLTVTPVQDVARYLPRFLEDCNRYVPASQLDIEHLEIIINLAKRCCECEPSIRLRCAEETWNLYTALRNLDQPIVKGKLNDSILNLAFVQFYGEKFDEVSILLSDLQQVTAKKPVKSGEVQKLCNLCLSRQLYRHVVVLLEYLMIVDHENVREYGKSVYQQLPHDAPEREKLKSLIGLQ